VPCLYEIYAHAFIRSFTSIGIPINIGSHACLMLSFVHQLKVENSKFAGILGVFLSVVESESDSQRLQVTVENETANSWVSLLLCVYIPLINLKQKSIAKLVRYREWSNCKFNESK
jgi:hypothetical protein